MTEPERSVLHVLPHPGGGGETYVDVLSSMPGYRFERVFLGAGARPSAGQLVRGVAHVVRRAREHDLLHVHGEVAGALCLPLLTTRPSVVTFHGLHLLRRLSGTRRKAAVLNLQAVLRAANGSICVSHAEHRILRAAVGPVAARRAVVIRNGVRLPSPVSASERAETRKELGVPESEVLGIWVGSLDERKDPLTAVRAAAKAGVALLVVGDGPLRYEVEQAAEEPVRVLGHRNDVSHLFQAADFIVLTSRREGLAYSVLEAMSYGLPALVTDLTENVEAVGDAGVIVPLGVEGAMESAIRRLVENAVERTAFGERARRRIDQLFNADEMIARTRALYGEVLAGREPRS